MLDLSGLNKEQQEAVKQVDGALLILAGAGSGKTKTITTRLAYLISQGIPPENTLTLTFTNKAAKEMKNRAYELLDTMKIPRTKEPLLCTFHHFGMMILKRYIHLLGYKNNFSILDTTDKKKIIKDLLKDSKDRDFSFYLRHIESVKNDLISEEEHYNLSLISGKSKIAYDLYHRYNNILKANNYLDFDDLLYLVYVLLNKYEDIKRHLSEEFLYIIVDEYQDTNKLQLEILKLLCFTHQNICVVGDEDQCIYSFRGSRIDNILNYEKQFKNVKIIRLEQNYRCTQNILDLANKVISNNNQRLGKKLFTKKQSTHNVELEGYSNAYEEAKSVVLKIKSLIQNGSKPSQIAVLYRLNNLSMLLEEELMKNNIAYALIGSLSFYERMEIKDAMAYLRLIYNPNDDISFMRIINTPKRGLGDTFLAKLQVFANEKKLSLFEALDLIDATKKQKENINKFLEIINNAHFADNLDDVINIINKDIDLSLAYVSMDNYEDKCENIKTFFASLKDKASLNTIGEILNELTLYDSHLKMDKDSEVYLMSVHASKGLEFENVFLVGFEEDTFPSRMNDNIEEERRLCYVAFTRAKERLFISYSHSRMKQSKIKSRFISEAFDSEFCDDFDDSSSFSQKFFNEKQLGFSKGDRVSHKLFGIGRVVEVNNQGSYVKLKINFAGNTKDIISTFVEKI